MIYKNGVKVKSIELKVNSKSVICHIHLSDGKVYSGKPQKIDPGTMHNQTNLETFSILVIARTIKLLREEMENV